MKLIAITQRVMLVPEYQERRDSLDQRWASLLHACGYLPYPIPNEPKLLEAIFRMPFHGIILTGGNTLQEDAPERDQVEIALLEYALVHEVPLLGVCRGMQLILSYFGSSLEKVQGHAAQPHPIVLHGEKTVVNSYHNYGTFQASHPLRVTGMAEDGVVEAVEHASLPIRGIMWHPERNTPLKPSDHNFLCRMLAK